MTARLGCNSVNFTALVRWVVCSVLQAGMPPVETVTAGMQCLQLLQFFSVPQDPRQILRTTWQVKLQPGHHPLLISLLPSSAAQPGKIPTLYFKTGNASLHTEAEVLVPTWIRCVIIITEKMLGENCGLRDEICVTARYCRHESCLNFPSRSGQLLLVCGLDGLFFK